MHKTAPMASLIETKSASAHYVAPKRTASAKPKSGLSARFMGLLLISIFSATAWYLIYRLVISLIHG